MRGGLIFSGSPVAHPEFHCSRIVGESPHFGGEGERYRDESCGHGSPTTLRLVCESRRSGLTQRGASGVLSKQTGSHMLEATFILSCEDEDAGGWAGD
jgi:hypothetical protein